MRGWVFNGERAARAPGENFHSLMQRSGLKSGTMKTQFHPIVLIIGVVLLTSCGGKDTHEKVTKDMLKEFEKVVKVVEGVDDKASAEKAVKKLEGMQGDFDKLKERVDTIGDPDEKTEKALEEKYDPKMNALGKRMEKALKELATKDMEALMTLQKGMAVMGAINSKP